MDSPQKTGYELRSDHALYWAMVNDQIVERNAEYEVEILRREAQLQADPGADGKRRVPDPFSAEKRRVDSFS